MKISDELFTVLKDAVAPFDTDESRTAYRNAGLTSMRYRWDMFWRAVDKRRFNVQDLDKEDLNDAHVDTALRKIIPDL